MIIQKEENEAVKRAIEVAGGRKNFAAQVGCSLPLVSRYVAGDVPVSAKNAVRIERATGITREELRPDIFGKL